MVNVNSFRKIALSFAGTMETPHFDRIAFRTAKRIFATLHPERMQANLKLSLEDQDVFSLIDKTKIYPVANKWGLQGWTSFELEKINGQLIRDALTKAYMKALDKNG